MTITLPLVAPGLVATGVFAFIQAWNEFIFALVIMNRPENQTLPVWLQAFNEGAQGHRLGWRHGRLDADGHPGRDLLPARPTPRRQRPDRRGGEGMSARHAIAGWPQRCLLGSFVGTHAPPWLLERGARRARRRVVVRPERRSTTCRSPSCARSSAALAPMS